MKAFRFVAFAASLLLFARAPVEGSFLVDVLPGMLLLGFGASFAFLTVISGFGKTVSVLGVLNDDSYLAPLTAFVEQMVIDKAAAPPSADTVWLRIG